MNKFVAVACTLGLLMSSGLGEVKAQVRSSCPGGEAKTASGTCVNPGLSASLRLRGTLLSQPKISQTAFPIPPVQDRIYPRPNEYDRFNFSRFGIFSTNPNPFSCHPNC